MTTTPPTNCYSVDIVWNDRDEINRKVSTKKIRDILRYVEDEGYILKQKKFQSINGYNKIHIKTGWNDWITWNYIPDSIFDKIKDVLKDVVADVDIDIIYIY